MVKKIVIFSTLFFLAFTLLSQSTFAADPFEDVCSRGNVSDSSVCANRPGSSNPLFGEDGILTKVIQILVMVVGVAAVIMIMVGGFKYIVSSGDSAQTSSAKNTILFAVIGLVVAVFAQAIVSFVLTKL